MTNNGTQANSNPLLAMAQRALEAKRGGQLAAKVAIDGTHVPEEAMAALRDMGKMSPEAQAHLDQLEGARQDIATNAWARQEWLRQRIQELGDKEIDPAYFVALLYAACARKLRNGKPALPLFQVRSLADQKDHPVNIIIPNVNAVDGGEKLGVRGLKLLAPTSPRDDLPVMKTLRGLRYKAAEALVEQLDGDYVTLLREAVSKALILMREASVYTAEMAERHFTINEDGVLVRKSNSRPGEYVRFVLSDDEHFIVKRTALADRLVAALNRLKQTEQDFWAGELDIDSTIVDYVNANRDFVVSPDEFLRGLPGIVAIQHDRWNTQDGPTRVAAVLERPQGEVRWRWAFATPEAVNSLFRGKQLYFHNWTPGELPKHVQALLRTGTPIVPE